MKKLLLTLLLFTLQLTTFSNESSTNIVVLSINGAIGPAYADYFVRSIDYATNNNASAILLTMDTPGGLDKSMRVMIQAISQSTIPIITYITPTGARAASAGTYLLYASHVAAMAPGTNLGAATPVSLAPSPSQPSATPENNEKKESSPSAMEKKVVNDAVAYIKGFADIHNRNAEWAEDAVRNAVSITATEALEKNVIDYVAENKESLIEQINRKSIIMNGKTETLILENITFTELNPDWKTKFLAVVTSPDIAYLLLITGVYLIIFELSNPGIVFAGVLGTLSLILSIYGLNLLPVNYVGLLLIIFGIFCLILEIMITSFGILGLIGTVVFTFGSFMLIDPGYGELAISPQLIFTMTIINALFFLYVIRVIINTYKKLPSVGSNPMLNKEAVCLSAFKESGQVKINGEIWRAITSIPLKKGESVIIKNIDGLTLFVEPKGENS